MVKMQESNKRKTKNNHGLQKEQNLSTSSCKRKKKKPEENFRAEGITLQTEKGHQVPAKIKC